MEFKALLIDLDDTVYAHTTGLWPAIRERINLYMYERLHIAWDEIPALRHQLYVDYGTTLRGLLVLYEIDQLDYLDFVHDLPLNQYLAPDPRLRDILKDLPQRRIIFTNADYKHAERVLEKLCISDCFEGIIDILKVRPYCKPQPEAFEIAMKEAGETDPSRCVFIDDTLENLISAHELGFFTIRVGSNESSPYYDAAIPTLHDLPRVLKNNQKDS